MNTQRFLVPFVATLLAIGSISWSRAADAPASGPAHAPVDADAVLRKVELNVGLKNYEKVLLAKFEAEFELQLGPPDRTLPAEQKVAWTESQKRKCDLLVRMAVDLREQIKTWIAADNGAAQAKNEPKPVPELIKADLDRSDYDLRIINQNDHNDRTPIAPRIVPEPVLIRK